MVGTDNNVVGTVAWRTTVGRCIQDGGGMGTIRGGIGKSVAESVATRMTRGGPMVAMEERRTGGIGGRNKVEHGGIGIRMLPSWAVNRSRRGSSNNATWSRRLRQNAARAARTRTS